MEVQRTGVLGWLASCVQVNWDKPSFKNPPPTPRPWLSTQNRSLNWRTIKASSYVMQSLENCPYPHLNLLGEEKSQPGHGKAQDI